MDCCATTTGMPREIDDSSFWTLRELRGASSAWRGKPAKNFRSFLRSLDGSASDPDEERRIASNRAVVSRILPPFVLSNLLGLCQIGSACQFAYVIEQNHRARVWIGDGGGSELPGTNRRRRLRSRGLRRASCWFGRCRGIRPGPKNQRTPNMSRRSNQRIRL